jgi:hypothetical protein
MLVGEARNVYRIHKEKPLIKQPFVGLRWDRIIETHCCDAYFGTLDQNR